MSYIKFLSDFALNNDDNIAVEFEEVFEDFYENSVISQKKNSDNSSSDSDEDDDDDSINSSSSSESSDLHGSIKKPKDFTDAQYAHVTNDVRTFMSEKCKCNLYKKKFSCCYYFEPKFINDMRDNCALRDSWENGINLLNELVLGALNTCVHNSEKHSKNESRINNHATLRLHGKRVCKDMFIFAHSFSIKRYDRIRNQLNLTGVELTYHGNFKNIYNKIESGTTKAIILFIENYANINGYPQPGRGASSIFYYQLK
jgi:hypothetical protein